jgi:glycosyltransferase involved in cell wall biosynthesis
MERKSQGASDDVSISLVMPAYNEAQVISTVVTRFAEVLEKFGNYEMIVVDDHSTDTTPLLLQSLQKENRNIRVILLQQNEGHGPALARAFREGKGKFIFHSDSDNQFNPEDFSHLWETMLLKKCDVVVGYREARDDGIARLMLTKALQMFLFLFLRVRFKDANSPFRLYTRETLDQILPVINERPMVPSIVMLLAAEHFKKRIEWVPVFHRARKTGRSFWRSWKVFKLSLPAVREILLYRKNIKNTNHIVK